MRARWGRMWHVAWPMAHSCWQGARALFMLLWCAAGMLRLVACAACRCACQIWQLAVWVHTRLYRGWRHVAWPMAHGCWLGARVLRALVVRAAEMAHVHAMA